MKCVRLQSWMESFKLFSHAPTAVTPNTHCSAVASPGWCDGLSILGASLMIIKLHLFVVLTCIFLIITGSEPFLFSSV